MTLRVCRLRKLNNQQPPNLTDLAGPKAWPVNPEAQLTGPEACLAWLGGSDVRTNKKKGTEE